MTWILLCLGLVLITAGAESLVRGSSTIALRLGISPLVVGLTVAAFGTSAPELVVSMKAGLDGFPDIAIGNVVGSNIFNSTIILGLTALILPIRVSMQLVRFDTPFMLGVFFLFNVIAWNRYVGRMEGVILLVLLAVYLFLTVRGARKESRAVQDEYAEVNRGGKFSGLLAVFFVLIGLGGLIYGGHLFVQSSVLIARKMGISEAVIGLTIVAAGTSLPELATSLVAAVRKAPDIAIGNVIGSNIFNVLCILGATSAVTPLAIGGISSVDLILMTGLGGLLLPFMWTGFILQRWEGFILVSIYGGYLWFLWPK